MILLSLRKGNMELKILSNINRNVMTVLNGKNHEFLYVFLFYMHVLWGGGGEGKGG